MEQIRRIVPGSNLIVGCELAQNVPQHARAARVEDAFRERVFSLYVVLFNVAFVAAAAVAALVVPESGKSYAVVAAIALGYALTAIAYARAARGVATGLPG